MQERAITQELVRDIVRELKPAIQEAVNKAVADELGKRSYSQDRLLTTKEIMDKLGISRSDFYHKGYNSILPSITLPGGCKRFFEEKCIAFLMSLSEE